MDPQMDPQTFIITIAFNINANGTITETVVLINSGIFNKISELSTLMLYNIMSFKSPDSITYESAINQITFSVFHHYLTTSFLNTMSSDILSELLDLANYLMMDELLKMIQYRQKINSAKPQHIKNIMIGAVELAKKDVKKSVLRKLGVTKTEGIWCLTVAYDEDDRNTLTFYSNSCAITVHADITLAGCEELKPISYEGFNVLESRFDNNLVNGVIIINFINYLVINNNCLYGNQTMYCCSNNLFKEYGYIFCTHVLVVRAAILNKKLLNIELWYIGINVDEWQHVHIMWQSFLDDCHKNNYMTTSSHDEIEMIQYLIQRSPN